MKTSAIWLALAALFACGPAPIPLAERNCVEGWWLGSETACSFECPTQPECSAADCMSRSVMGLRATGDSVFSYISVSESEKQFSEIGARTTDKWTLAKPGDLILHTGEDPIVTRCRDSRLDLGLATYARANASMQAAFETAIGTSKWSSVKF